MKALRRIFAVAFVVVVMATALLAASPAGAASKCQLPKKGSSTSSCYPSGGGVLS